MFSQIVCRNQVPHAVGSEAGCFGYKAPCEPREMTTHVAPFAGHLVRKEPLRRGIFAKKAGSELIEIFLDAGSKRTRQGRVVWSFFALRSFLKSCGPKRIRHCPSSRRYRVPVLLCLQFSRMIFRARRGFAITIDSIRASRLSVASSTLPGATRAASASNNSTARRTGPSGSDRSNSA